MIDVIVIPKNKLKDYITDKNYIIISTTTDDTPAVVNVSEDKVIRFTFEDIGRDDKGRIFSKEDAFAIKNFVSSHLDNLEQIVCSCDAGISRSPAIAAAISYWLNGTDKPIWDNPIYRPNSFVYTTLLYTLME